MTYPQHAPRPEYGYQPAPYLADPGPPPTSIQVVFWLVLAQNTIGLVFGIVIAYLSKDALLAKQSLPSGVDPESVFQAGIALAVVFGVGFGALWILFAAKLRQGRNWARITMMVLCAVSLVLTPFNLLNPMSTTPITPLTLTSYGIGLVANLVILVLLACDPAKSWTPAKTAFLKTRAAPRY